MDQCFIDLMDRREQINLLAIMIRHILRIANTLREHDLGYGFLMTLVFEHFGISLQKKVRVQMIDEIGSSTLMGCGFKLVKGDQAASEQGPRTPFLPVPGSSSSEPFVDHLLLDQNRLKTELTEVRAALVEKKFSMPSAMRISCRFLQPSQLNSLLLHPNKLYPLIPFLFCLPLFFHLFSTTVSHYLVVLCD